MLKLVGVRPGDDVRAAFDDVEPHVLDQADSRLPVLSSGRI
jgi:hypothetical protein